MCRKCGVVRAGANVSADEAAEVLLRRRRAARRLPWESAARLRAVAEALADTEAACKQLDDAVEAVCRRHDPLGCLSGVLGLVTGLIVAAVTLRSLRWYFVVSWSLSGAVLTWIVLHAVSVVSWMRHHPLLHEMYKVRHRWGDDDGDIDPMVSEKLSPHITRPRGSSS